MVRILHWKKEQVQQTTTSVVEELAPPHCLFLPTSWRGNSWCVNQLLWKKRSCSRPAVLIVNFYNLLICFIVLQIWIFYSFLSFSPNISLPPLVSVDHNFLYSKKALNNNDSDLPRQPEGSNSQVPLNFWGNLAPNSSRFFLKMSFLN